MEPGSGAHSLCGTPEYLSPEVLDRQGHGTAVDWWNLGMVTYEMLTGLPPWYTTDRQKLFERLRRATLKFPFYVSRPAASLIQGMLTRDPSTYFPQSSLSETHSLTQILFFCGFADERLGARGVEEIKAHPFFATVDWVALYERRITPPFNPCRNQDIVVRVPLCELVWKHLSDSTYLLFCCCSTDCWQLRDRIYRHALAFGGRDEHAPRALDF